MVLIKKGFVSNSSTCSFILAGWPIVETDEELAKIFGIEEDDYDDLYDILYGSGDYPVHNYTDEGNFIGIELARWSSDDFDLDLKMSIDELTEKLESVKDMAKKLGIDVKTVKLYAGMYGC